MPGLTPSWGGVLAEAASVCLKGEAHSRLVELRVDGTFDETLTLKRFGVTLRMLLSHHDEEEATEMGACGVAILALQNLADLVVVRRARKGMGFDYWLGPSEGSLLQQAEHLEVSGIRNGSETAVKARFLEKTRQTQKFRTTTPTWVAVVEFSRPMLRLVKLSRPDLRIVKS
jgi:hypothetical protein